MDSRTRKIAIWTPVFLAFTLIIGILLGINLQSRKLLSVYNMELKVSAEAVSWIAEHGFDPQSGARPVKRLIQRELVNELSKEIIAGRISKDSVVNISVENGSLKFVSGKP